MRRFLAAFSLTARVSDKHPRFRPFTCNILLLVVAAGLLGAVARVHAQPQMRVEPRFLTYVSGAMPEIFVEIDWMDAPGHSHKPSQAVVDKIVETFALAGYAIHIDVSNAIPHQDVLTITGSVANSPDIQAIMATHFNNAADTRYHYSLWCHNYRIGSNPPTGSSGIADLPGRVHLVSLGSFPGQVGTFAHQVGTFIHELGHNLGQLHGGANSVNYKPNYISVMNYHYQLSGIGPVLAARGWAGSVAGFDQFSYSHGALPPLNQANLNEPDGIGLGIGVDWNCNETATDTNVSKFIAASSWCSAVGPLSVIGDFDNWANIKPFIRTGAPGGGESLEFTHSLTEPEPCISWEEHQHFEEILANLFPSGFDALTSGGAAGDNAGLSTGSVRLYNDGDAPLTILSIGLDAPAPWISWSPKASFDIPPGSFLDLAIEFDLAKAPIGRSKRQLIVSSNDVLSGSPFPGGIYLILEFDGVFNAADGRWTRY